MPVKCDRRSVLQGDPYPIRFATDPLAKLMATAACAS